MTKVFVSTDGIEPPLCQAAYTYNAFGAIELIQYNESSAGVFETEVDYSYTERDWIKQIGDINSTTKPFAAKYDYDYTGNIDEAEFFNRETQITQERKYKYDFNYDKTAVTGKFGPHVMDIQINHLMDMAIKDNDHITQEFLRWFVNEQLEEVSTMDTLLNVIRRAGDNMLWVEDFLARNPIVPEEHG